MINLHYQLSCPSQHHVVWLCWMIDSRNRLCSVDTGRYLSCCICQAPCLVLHCQTIDLFPLTTNRPLSCWQIEDLFHFPRQTTCYVFVDRRILIYADEQHVLFALTDGLPFSSDKRYPFYIDRRVSVAFNQQSIRVILLYNIIVLDIVV